jgi:hypothetical protein
MHENPDANPHLCRLLCKEQLRKRLQGPDDR